MGADQAQISVEFDGAGTFGLGDGENACGCTDATAVNYDETAQYDDGSCEFDVPGCTDATACNFNPEATLDDDSCEFPADNFDCDGNCIADVDCNGVCGGDATEDALGPMWWRLREDADADGICDDVDDCVGELDACGVCNGPGEIYECGCADIPEGDCDCDGTKKTPWAFAAAIARLTRTLTASATMWTTALASLTLVAFATVLERFRCGCSDIPAGDCDCDGNQLDALGVCGGDCAAKMPMRMASAMMWMTALASLMLAACAYRPLWKRSSTYRADQMQDIPAVWRLRLRRQASSTPWACVVTAQKMPIGWHLRQCGRLRWRA